MSRSSTESGRCYRYAPYPLSISLVLGASVLFIGPKVYAQSDRERVPIIVTSADNMVVGASVTVRAYYSQQEYEDYVISADQDEELELKSCNRNVHLRISADSAVTHMPKIVACKPNPLHVVLSPFRMVSIENLKVEIWQEALELDRLSRRMLLREARNLNSEYSALLVNAYRDGDMAGMAYVANEAAWAARSAGRIEEADTYSSITLQTSVATIAELQGQEVEAIAADAFSVDVETGAIVLSHDGKSLIEHFQAEAGLPPTGVLGPRTMEALVTQAPVPPT